jgi:SAM-dependent methyltransferase
MTTSYSDRTANEPLWQRKLRRGAHFVTEHGLGEVWRRARRLGIGGCVEYAAINLRFIRGDAVNRWFDFIHGVDTSGQIASDELTVVGEHKNAGADFLSTPAKTLRRALNALPKHVEPSFTFIDVGCGKGRALLIAAERNFRRVIGIEHAPALAAVAERNAAAWRGRRRCTDIRVICADAMAYEFPTEPLVLYFFGPFADKAVLAHVVENLAASLRASPRPIYVVYLDAVEQQPPDAAMATAGLRPLSRPGGERLFDAGIMRCPVFYAVYGSGVAETCAQASGE